jgi:hypothetical protein
MATHSPRSWPGVSIRAFLRELPETDVEPATSAGTMMDG